MMDEIFIGTKFTGHDSAIFVIDNKNKKIFAIATERLTRYKHDSLYVIPAINKYLKYENINTEKVEKVHVSITNKDLEYLKVYKNQYAWHLSERRHLKASYIGDYKNKYKNYKSKNILNKIQFLFKSRWGLYILYFNFIKFFLWGYQETLDKQIKKHFGIIFKNAQIIVNYYDHQYCHALSSFVTSPFDEALHITCDGYGDDSFSKVYIQKNNNLRLLANSSLLSVGLFNRERTEYEYLSFGGVYEYFTEQLGFDRISDPGKVEALAAFGNFNNEIYELLRSLVKIDREKNCSIFSEKIFIECFNHDKMREYKKKYSREDMAAALQKFLENSILEYFIFLKKKFKANNVCLSGGVTANVIMNMRIFEEVFENIHITPAMADDGTAQGAVVANLIQEENIEDLNWLRSNKMPYFGTSYSRKEVEEVLKVQKGIIYIEAGDEWPKEVAERIARGEIGAIFHGRMEWGPRALGNRSIVADPRRSDFRDRINKTIKKRPAFQPFCPSILAEEKNRLFKDAYLNKHMTCAFKMKKEYRKKLPGAIHIDGTARVQFVEEKDNPNFFKILKHFKTLTGFGVLINTSFNKHGRTIVESPEDAVRDFIDTDLDFLLIEGFLVEKERTNNI